MCVFDMCTAVSRPCQHFPCVHGRVNFSYMCVRGVNSDCHWLGGDLITCDYPDCTKVYHMNCVALKNVPSDKWMCPRHFCLNSTLGNSGADSYAAYFQCRTCPRAYSARAVHGVRPTWVVHLPSRKLSANGII